MVSLGKMLFPAILGALLSAVLSVIPVVSYGCCLWIALGGLLSAWLSGKDEKGATVLDGAKAGALSGLFTALLVIVILGVVFLFFGGIMGAMTVGFGALFASASRSLAPLIAFAGMGLLYALFLLVVILTVAAVYLVMFSAIGAIGGAVCGSLLYKKE